MALDFPANPTNGQTFGTYIYDSSIPGWRNVNSSEGIGLQFKSGLVPIIPTSITVGSGSASVSPTGVITLTSVDTPVINGIFSSAYANYRVVVTNNTGVADTFASQVYARFATGGAQNTSNNYTYTVFYSQAGSTGGGGGTGTGTNWTILGYHRNLTMDIYTPFVSGVGASIYATGVYNHTWHIAEGGYNAAASFDGLVLGNNFYTATVRVYGYN